MRPLIQSDVNATAIREQLARVVAGRAFSGSGRMSRFLRFVVEQSLAGRAGELKEYLIGVEVFDRPFSYDPRVDPIVRVEARRLRGKLKAYYEEEGGADPIVIELPKGTYAPRFHKREVKCEQPPQVEVAHTIAVLPFTNVQPGEEGEYLSDGLTEELIHALANVEGLRVVAWNSSLQLKQSGWDIYTIGRQLNVASVVLGNVRRAGDRLRIRVQLVDTRNGYYLWSESYDRQARDLIAIQEEIAAAIARTLRMKLRVLDRGPADIEAHNLYLKGRYEANKRTADGLRRSIDYYQSAIARDENYAFAWAAAADSYALLAEYGVLAAAEVMDQARFAATRALDINPRLAEAEAALGLITSLHDWKWAEAGDHYRRAMELNPAYASAFHWYGTDYLALYGRFEEALHYLDIALQLDPLSSIMREGRAFTYTLARRYDDAYAAATETIEFNPYFFKGYASMGRVLVQQGQYRAAIEQLKKALALSPGVPNILGVMTQAYALYGDEDAARRTLGELSALAKTRTVTGTCFAIAHIGLGELDRALDWLEHSSRLREMPIAIAKIHPVYDPLRGHPRFEALIETVGPPSTP